MKLHFDCYCPTQWGQRLVVTGSSAELGAWDLDKALPLECCDLNRWRAAIDCNGQETVYYKYVLVGEKDNYQMEVGHVRMSPTAGGVGDCHCIDAWQELPTEFSAYLSSAFTDVFFGAASRFADKPQRKRQPARLLELTICVPMLKPTQYVCVTGNCSQLGNWSEMQPMAVGKYATWHIRFAISDLPAEFEYKFVVRDTADDSFTYWEPGSNHRFIDTYSSAPIVLKIDDGVFTLTDNKMRFAGVNVPVFSLRTENSCGVGDFSDLKRLIDWAARVGLKMIQILPINDTISTYSFLDSYPYNAISVFALNPLFIDIFKLGKLVDNQQQSKFEADARKLNDGQDVDYEKVIRLKLDFCRALFAQNQADIVGNKEFKAFVEQNAVWLEPYAAFSTLRDKFRTGDFNSWGKFATYSEKTVKQMFEPKSQYFSDVMFWCCIQFELDRQLREASAHARRCGIILKGDLPIGISRCSVDAWCAPKLYNFDGQAGAPPDFFSENGQNWGFPTYNWDEMAKDGYAWWRQRLAKMNSYFDAYRIDHILGFFRIWEIPTTAVHGILGHFNPSLPLSEGELFRRGIVFDYSEACIPTTDAETIDKLFGNQAETVKKKYLVSQADGLYRLKPEFATQRLIYSDIVGGKAPDSLSRQKRQLLDGLLTIAADVLLIKDEATGGYHPRIDLQKTSSYKRLPKATRDLLDAVYEDYFYHRHDAFWRKQAEVKLSALLKASDMLVCGEDLGMIPNCVKPVMDELGILSLEIQRMPKTFTEFADLQTIPYTSICATSTHDISTIRGWWEENAESTQRYYNNWLKLKGKTPAKASVEICKLIIDSHLQSPAMCVMIPIQDFFALEPSLRVKNVEQERINVPANPRNYWKYRMHEPIEKLMKSRKLNGQIADMLEKTGRRG